MNSDFASGDSSGSRWARTGEPRSSFSDLSSRGRSRGGGRGRGGQRGGSNQSSKLSVDSTASTPPPAETKPATPVLQTAAVLEKPPPSPTTSSISSKPTSSSRRTSRSTPTATIMPSPNISEASSNHRNHNRKRLSTNGRSGGTPKVLSLPEDQLLRPPPNARVAPSLAKDTPPHFSSFDIRSNIDALVERVRAVAMENRPNTPGSHIDWADEDDSLPDLDDWGVTTKPTAMVESAISPILVDGLKALPEPMSDILLVIPDEPPAQLTNITPSPPATTEHITDILEAAHAESPTIKVYPSVQPQPSTQSVSEIMPKASPAPLANFQSSIHPSLPPKPVLSQDTYRGARGPRQPRQNNNGNGRYLEKKDNFQEPVPNNSPHREVKSERTKVFIPSTLSSTRSAKPSQSKSRTTSPDFHAEGLAASMHAPQHAGTTVGFAQSEEHVVPLHQSDREEGVANSIHAPKHAEDTAAPVFAPKRDVIAGRPDNDGVAASIYAPKSRQDFEQRLPTHQRAQTIGRPPNYTRPEDQASRDSNRSRYSSPRKDSQHGQHARNHSSPAAAGGPQPRARPVITGEAISLLARTIGNSSISSPRASTIATNE